MRLCPPHTPHFRAACGCCCCCCWWWWWSRRFPRARGGAPPATQRPQPHTHSRACRLATHTCIASSAARGTLQGPAQAAWRPGVPLDAGHRHPPHRPLRRARAPAPPACSQRLDHGARQALNRLVPQGGEAGGRGGVSGGWRAAHRRTSPSPPTHPPQGLRLHDNPALLEGARGAAACYPLFILDPWFLSPDK